MQPILAALWPIQDAASIASCNVPAFFADKHWRHEVSGTPLHQLVTYNATRTPWTCVLHRKRWRCLKAVDPDTSTLIGYARWILPDSMIGDDTIWPEALIHSMTAHEAAQFQFDSEMTFDSKTGHAREVNHDMVCALGSADYRQYEDIIAKISDKPFIELEYIAVREGWQCKGVGKMLVRAGINKARELNCHLIIMAFTEKSRIAFKHMPELQFFERVEQKCEIWPVGRPDGCASIVDHYYWLCHDGDTQMRG